MEKEISEELKLARESLCAITEAIVFEELKVSKEIEDKIDAWTKVYKEEEYTIKK